MNNGFAQANLSPSFTRPFRRALEKAMISKAESPHQVLDWNRFPIGWNPTKDDREVVSQIQKLLPPERIVFFDKECSRLSDYWYWYTLSTMWVDYTGFSDINLWRKHFLSDRPLRAPSIMKPTELDLFMRIPAEFFAYRVHRPGESDWIAYTICRNVAQKYCQMREVQKIHVYRLRLEKCVSIFLRREEHEIIMPHRDDSNLEAVIEVNA